MLGAMPPHCRPPQSLLRFLAEPSSSGLDAPQNGSLVFAMRHGNYKARLGRPADQRKALVRALVTEVLRHGKITTTKIRAKAIRKYVDKMIGLAKDGSLHARRQVRPRVAGAAGPLAVCGAGGCCAPQSAWTALAWLWLASSGQSNCSCSRQPCCCGSLHRCCPPAAGHPEAGGRKRSQWKSGVGSRGARQCAPLTASPGNWRPLPCRPWHLSMMIRW